jgi:hypothetical protein
VTGLRKKEFSPLSFVLQELKSGTDIFIADCETRSDPSKKTIQMNEDENTQASAPNLTMKSNWAEQYLNIAEQARRKGNFKESLERFGLDICPVRKLNL